MGGERAKGISMCEGAIVELEAQDWHLRRGERDMQRVRSPETSRSGSSGDSAAGVLWPDLVSRREEEQVCQSRYGR